MDNALLTTIVSTGGSVIVGVAGMWIATNSLGKSIDDMGKRIDRLEDRFNLFAETANGKLAALDSEIAILLDRKRGEQ